MRIYQCKKGLIYLILIGICIGIFGCGNFGDPREKYENAVNQIGVENIDNKEYITSISVDSDFNKKEGNSFYDTINIHVNLVDDFEELEIEEKCSIIYKMQNELNTILENARVETGYKDLIIEDTTQYRGVTAHIFEYLYIYYNSSFNEYSFSKGSLDILYVNNIQDADKFEEYNIQWNGNSVASIEKEEKNYSQSYDIPQSSNEENISSISNAYTGAYDATLKYSGTDGVLICTSEDAMERFMTAVNNGNEGTLQELFLNGQCAYTEQGTKCNIVDRKITKCQVKLLDGTYAGNTVWVVIEALQEK